MTGRPPIHRPDHESPAQLPPDELLRPLSQSELEKLSTNELEDRLWGLITRDLRHLKPADLLAELDRRGKNMREAMRKIRLARIKGRK